MKVSLVILGLLMLLLELLQERIEHVSQAIIALQVHFTNVNTHVLVELILEPMT